MTERERVLAWLETIGVRRLAESAEECEWESFDEALAFVRAHPITFTSATLKEGVALGIFVRG